MNTPRPIGVVKRQQATSTLMGTLFARALAEGAMQDRTARKQTGGRRRRIAVPTALAKFFRPIGGLNA